MMMSDARMILRVVAGILGLVAIVEGWYIFSLRNQVNRFHLMDDSGYVAFDRVSGQLCKTFQLNLAKSSVSANARDQIQGIPFLMQSEILRAPLRQRPMLNWISFIASHRASTLGRRAPANGQVSA
jgi:hypothetical protein